MVAFWILRASISAMTSTAGIVSSDQPDRSRLRGMPHPLDAVSSRLAGLFVFGKTVQRMSLIGPLFLAGDRGYEITATAGLVMLVGNRGRPNGRALPRASALSWLRVLVERVERHAIFVDHYAIRNVGCLRV